jgi:signal transduction histidine kinase
MLPSDTTNDRRGGGGHPTAAAAVLVACAALAAASTVVWALARPPWTFEQWFFVVDLADAVVYGVVAWVLLARSRHVVAWLLAVTAVGGGLAALGAGWTSLLVDHPDLPTLNRLQWLQNSAWVPGTLALIVIVPWLVRDEPLGRIPRIAVGAGVAVIGWMVVVRVTDPFPWPQGASLAPLPVRSAWWSTTIEDWFVPQIVAVCTLGAVATAGVVLRWRRLPDERRRGLGWLAVATGLMTASFVPLALPDAWASHLPLELTPVVHLLSQAFLPAALLVAILRQRMWRIDLAVSRGVLWSLLTAVVVLGSVLIAAAVRALVPTRPGLQQVVATAAVVACFIPVRTWLQLRVDRLVHGEAVEPARVARQVGRQLGAARDAADLVDGLTAGLVQSLRLGTAVIVDADGTELARAGGDAVPGRPETRELVHQRESAGRLEVTPRPGERFDARTLAALDELVPVLAAAVHLAATTRALTESRARIAAARDEERRALRRELHDGLGPALAGVGLGLRAGRNLLERDPAAAAALLDQLAAELDARVEEVRGLARGLVPPALDELGLLPALQELAERYRVGGLDVAIEPGGDEPPWDLTLDAVVAGAVFGIVSEAVRNVHRHAAATRCVVRLDAGDELVVRVVDDGIGLDPAAPAGVGLRSMRERAEGVGGTLEVAAIEPHGTAVEVRVPVLAVATEAGS